MTNMKRHFMFLNKIEQEAIRQFKTKLLDTYGNNLNMIILFGSKSRGDFDDESDIDVLVILNNDDWEISRSVHEISTDILLETNISISPKIISTRHFHILKDENAPFLMNVINDGQEL